MTDVAQYDEINLMDILLILKKYWKMVIGLTLAMGLISCFITVFFIQPKYESQVVFEIINVTELENIELKKQISNPDYHLELIRTRQFLEDVLNKSGLNVDEDSINQLRESVQVQKTPSDTFRIQVKWIEPEFAYKLARNISIDYQQNFSRRLEKQDDIKRVILQEQLESKQAELIQAENELTVYEKENGISLLAHQVIPNGDNNNQDRNLSDILRTHRLLQAKRDAVRQSYLLISDFITELVIDTALVKSITIQVIEPPVVPQEQSSPSLPLNITIAIFLGAFTGMFLAFFIEYFKNYKNPNLVQ